MINIPSAIDETKKKKIKVYPCHVNRASNSGKECERSLVYERTAWDKKLLHDVGLQYIFDEGNRSEEITMQEITEAGIQIFEGQRSFEYTKNAENIVTGKIDFTITQDAIPVEAKSINPYDFQTISDIESVRNHKKAHIRGYLAQLNIYLFLKEKEYGILLFRDKNSGRYKQVDVTLDYQLVEDTLQKFERVNAHIKAGTLPEKISDLSVCKTCSFRAHCLPESDFGEGFKIVSDNYIEQLIKTRATLEAAASNYDTLDKQLKDIIKTRCGDAVGNLVINGRWEAHVKTHGKGLRVDIGKLGEISA